MVSRVFLTGMAIATAVAMPMTLSSRLLGRPVAAAPTAVAKAAVAPAGPMTSVIVRDTDGIWRVKQLPLSTLPPAHLADTLVEGTRAAQ